MRGAKAHHAVEFALEFERVFSPGERVVIACSGGPDSVALAALLAASAPTLELQLTIAHVNHGLRRSAWQDEAVVLRVSAALRVPVRIPALTPDRRDAALLRDARYEALAPIAEEVGAQSVATAHTAEDQTETVLLALFRGTGSDGLAGMPVRRPLRGSIELVRPLLRCDHGRLQRYAQAWGLPYALDPSNRAAVHRRNAVRGALVALREAFPGLDAAVSRAAAIAADEREGDPRSALRRRVRSLLREQDALADVDFAHVEEAVRALETGRSGSFFMNGEVELRIAGGEIRVRRNA